MKFDDLDTKMRVFAPDKCRRSQAIQKVSLGWLDANDMEIAKCRSKLLIGWREVVPSFEELCCRI